MIALERRDVREQVMRHEDGLGPAQVGVGGHRGRPRRLCLIDEGFNERAYLRLHRRDTAAEIHPEVERDLLVARTPGVQAAPEVADRLDELVLDK
jgi:hypothetical protein